MNLVESVRIAMRALAANKLRSILTMLGIIIGVGAVIALMSIGRGVEKYVTDQFAGLGSNLLFITPGSFADGPPQARTEVRLLTISDAEALADRSRIPSVRALAAEYSANATIARGKQNMRTTVHAATATYPDVINWEVELGSFFSQTDVDERARVVVLGADVYRRLFEPITCCCASSA
jgi:putative ABC transport system permease protein